MDEELSTEDLIELLKLECPCTDPECVGVWLARHESEAVIRALKELQEYKAVEFWMELNG